jgi:hypothetical protein
MNQHHDSNKSEYHFTKSGYSIGISNATPEDVVSLNPDIVNFS